MPASLSRRAVLVGAAVLAAFLVGGAAQWIGSGHVAERSLAAAAAFGLALAAVLGPVRTRVPLAVLAGAAVTALGSTYSADVGWFAFCVLVSWAALVLPRWQWIALWVAAVVVLVGEFVADHDPGWTAWVVGTSFSALVAALARRQFELVAQLQAAQAGLAARAQAEERARIARELHDVIAHSLTVSLLHVSAARLALSDAPDEAAHSLAEAERLGRASLDEVRQAVGLVRGGTTPLPGAGDLPALVETHRRTGASVDAQLAPSLAAVSATTGLAAYRIVQESLTNAAKHAPGRAVSLRVSCEDGGVAIDVRNAGSAAGSAAGDGTGLGLIGMRERAVSVGGTCRAGVDGDGWRVEARLPLVRP